jgi:hypothetical protein
MLNTILKSRDGNKMKKSLSLIIAILFFDGWCGVIRKK